MFGRPIVGSVNSRPGALTPGQTGTWATKLDQITCRALFGPLLQPVDQFETLREMGIAGNVNQIRRVDADWPLVLVNGRRVPYNADDWPVRPGDQLVVNGNTYSIKGVKAYPPFGAAGGLLIMYVEVPA